MAAEPPWPVSQQTDGELLSRRKEIGDLIMALPATSARIAGLRAEVDEIAAEQKNRARYRRSSEIDPWSDWIA